MKWTSSPSFWHLAQEAAQRADAGGAVSDTILWQETISKDAPAATRRSKRQRGWDEQPSKKQSWYPNKVWRADRQKRGPQERRMRNRGDLASSPGGGGTRPAASSSYPNLVKVKAMPRPPGPRRHRRVHLAPSCLVAPAFFCFPFSTPSARQRWPPRTTPASCTYLGSGRGSAEGMLPAFSECCDPPRRHSR